MPDTPSKTCAHGQLQRSCEICELERENAELRETLAEASVYVRQANNALMLENGSNARESALLAKIDRLTTD